MIDSGVAASYESDKVDASDLLAFTTGFLPRDIAVETRKEIESRLANKSWMRRSEFITHQEGAFLICSFWRINHLIQEGELDRAEDMLEQMIAQANPLGLYSEEIDPATGAFLGNFPQAFSHLALIESILNLEHARKDPKFAALPDHKKFAQSVGPTIGWKGIIAGFWRVPPTFRLLLSRKSKWQPISR
jgi:alpha,alpha-trehalase